MMKKMAIAIKIAHKIMRGDIDLNRIYRLTD